MTLLTQTLALHNETKFRCVHRLLVAVLTELLASLMNCVFAHNVYLNAQNVYVLCVLLHIILNQNFPMVVVANES
jgi:hypothetical protein